MSSEFNVKAVITKEGTGYLKMPSLENATSAFTGVNGGYPPVASYINDCATLPNIRLEILEYLAESYNLYDPVLFLCVNSIPDNLITSIRYFPADSFKKLKECVDINMLTLVRVVCAIVSLSGKTPMQNDIFLFLSKLSKKMRGE